MSGAGNTNITLVQAEQARNQLLGQLDEDLRKLASTLQFIYPNVRIMGNISGPIGDGANELNWLFNLAMKTGDQLTTAGAAGWLLVSAVAAAGNSTFTLKKNGVSIGTALISAGQTQGVWTFASTVTFTDYDRLSFVPPSPADTSLSDVAWTIIGTRTQ